MRRPGPVWGLPADTAYVDDPGEAALGHQDVPWHQVAVAHHIGRSASGQLSPAVPQRPQPGHVEQAPAALQAGLHPRVLPAQHSSTTGTGEPPAAGLDRAYGTDEDGKVGREAGRLPAARSVATTPGTQVCTDQGSG